MEDLDRVIQKAGHKWFSLNDVKDFKNFPQAYDKDGIIEKKPRGGGLKNIFVKNKWTKRRLNLSHRDRKIFYFDCNSGEVKGDLNLDGAEFKIVPDLIAGRNVFEIKEKNSTVKDLTHTLVLKAPSDIERMDWLKALLLSTKWREIQDAKEGKKRPTVVERPTMDQDIRFSEVLLGENGTTENDLEIETESIEEKANRLGAFKKRNTIAKQIRQSLSGQKVVKETRVSTYKKGQRLPPPPPSKTIRDSIVDPITKNLEAVRDNAKPLIEDTKNILENAKESNIENMEILGKNLSSFKEQTIKNSKDFSRRASQSIRRSSIAFQDNLKPLKRDVERISQEVGENAKRASLRMRDSITDTSHISRRSKDIQEGVRSSLRRSSVALQRSMSDFENNLKPLKNDISRITANGTESVRKDLKSIRKSLSLGGSPVVNQTEISRNSLGSSRKNRSNLAKFGFKPMIEEDNEKETIDIVSISKSVPKPPGGPPTSSTSKTEENNNEQSSDVNIITTASTNQTTKEGNVKSEDRPLENQEKELLEKENSVLEGEENKELQSNKTDEDGHDVEKVEPESETETTEDISTNIVVNEESSKSDSDFEFSLSSRPRTSSKSSRASIRYLENLQKSTTLEEKTQEPKKREKRVSIAAQRYLAATSISSVDDKNVILEEQEEKNTDENTEPKFISNEEQTEELKEVIEGA